MPRARAWLSLFGRVALTVAIFAVILNRIPLAEVGSAYLDLAVLPLLWALALAILGRAVRALQLKRLTDAQGLEVPLLRMAEINLATGFYQLFLPSTLTGAGVRWLKLTRPGKELEALTSVVASRLAEVLTLVVLGLGFWLATSQSGLAHRAAFWAMGAPLLVFALALPLQGRLRTGKLPAWGDNSVGRAFLRAFQQFDALTPRTRAEVLALAALGHLVATGSWLWLAQCLGLTLSFAVMAWVRAVVVLVSMLPISISGLGVREGALILLLAPYAIAGSEAVALSFVIFGTQLLFGLLGGLLELRASIVSR